MIHDREISPGQAVGETLAEARAALAERGYASLGGVLDASAVAELNRELGARDLARGEYGILANQAWTWHEGFAALVRGGRLAALARELLQTEEVVFFQDNLVWKPPGTTTRLEWHQDYSYWPLDAPRGVTLWLALDDADPEAVAAPARAGELLAHDPLVWHMSPVNRSALQRRAWSLTWISAEVRWAPDHAPHPFHYLLQPAPGARVEGPWFPRFCAAKA